MSSAQWADSQRATPSFVSAAASGGGGGGGRGSLDGSAAGGSNASIAHSPLISKPIPESLSMYASTPDQIIASNNATRLSNTGVGGSYLNTVSRDLLADRSSLMSPRATSSTPRAANNTTPNRHRRAPSAGITSPGSAGGSSSYYGDQSVFESLVSRGKLSQQKKDIAMLEALAEEKRRCRSVPRISSMGHNLTRPSSIFTRLERVQGEKDRDYGFKMQAIDQKEEKYINSLFKPKISSRGRRAAGTAGTSNARTTEKFSFKTKQRMDQIRSEKAVKEMENILGSPDINPRSAELAARQREREGMSGYSHLDAMLERDRLLKLARYEQHERQLHESVPGTPRITEYAASLQRGSAATVGDRLYRSSFEAKDRIGAEREAEDRRLRMLASRTHSSAGVIEESSVRARSAPSGSRGGQQRSVVEVQGSLMDHLAATKAQREERARRLQEESQREYTYRPAINAVSDAIAARLPLSSQDRLLDGNSRRTTATLQQPPLQQSPSPYPPPSAASTPSSAGISLFERLKVAEARRKVRVDNVRRTVEAGRMSECTFTPTTTTGYYPPVATSETVPARNADWLRQRDDKLNRMRAEHADDDLEGCTYEPTTTGSFQGSTQVPTAMVVAGYDSFVDRHQRAKQEAAANAAYHSSRGEGPSLHRPPTAQQPSIYGRATSSPVLPPGL